MLREIKPSVPVFLVPGNHDFDYNPSVKKKKGEGLTLEGFKIRYGI